MNYQIYHETYSSCIREMEKVVEKSKFAIDPDEQFSVVGINSKRPKIGGTTRFSLSLSREGKTVKKSVHVQVYGMSNGNFELNCYIL